VIRVLIVDDHPVVVEGLASILATEPDFRVEGQASSGEEALQKSSYLRPDVVLLDVRLPGMSGVSACERIVRTQPGTRVLMITSFPSAGTIATGLAAGAAGVLLKDSEPTTIREAVRSVAGGETFMDPRISRKIASYAERGVRGKGPFGLSPAEMRVIEYLPRGLTNQQIADELGLSEHTVKSHMHTMFQKINAKDRTEAAAIAMREGLA
jgi:NarL family two-component system response regulator LiaR